MNAQLNHVLARKGTAVTRPKSLEPRSRRFAARVLGPLIALLILAVLTLSASAGRADPLGQVTEFSTGLPAGSYPPPPTPALAALDITPRMFTLTGRRVGRRCQQSSLLNRRQRPGTRPVVLHGTTVINSRVGADAFTFTGKIGGRELVPGSYRLLAMPTIDGIAGRQQQTTFEMTR